jgi:hypothetical protein
VGEIVQEIRDVRYETLKSGPGAFLTLACGHQRWIGGFPRPVAGKAVTIPSRHRCLTCEDSPHA